MNVNHDTAVLIRPSWHWHRYRVRSAAASSQYSFLVDSVMFQKAWISYLSDGSRALSRPTQPRAEGQAVRAVRDGAARCRKRSASTNPRLVNPGYAPHVPIYKAILTESQQRERTGEVTMTQKSLHERVRDATEQLLATAVGGAAGYYAGRKIEGAGGGAAGGAIGGLMASTAATNLVKEALNRLNRTPNPSDQAIQNILHDLYTTQSPLHRLVEAQRSANT